MSTQQLDRPTTPLDATTTKSRARTRRLSPNASLVLLASIVVTFLAASSAPTPLYAVYQASWGFAPITTTAVFGVYALAVLTALLVFGRLSDHVGRRPVLLTAIGVQVAAMLIFATASGVDALFAARVVQGLSTGAAIGAVGAAMLDLHPVRGTLANAVTPPLGTGIGALASGVVVDLLPWPRHLVYLALLVIFAVQALGVAFMSETVQRTHGAIAALVPEFSLPRAVRRPFLLAAPVLIAVWGLAGFYGSLGPSLVRTIVGSSSLIYGGLGLFVLAAAGAATVLATRSVAAHRVMLVGVVSLLIGLAITLTAIRDTAGGSFDIAMFFSGTAFAGAGFGAGFQGGVRTVVPRAAAHERAGVLSLLYTVSYLGFGVPAVVAGAVVTDLAGLTVTAEGYVVLMMALALVALAGLLRWETPTVDAVSGNRQMTQEVGR